MYFTYLSASQRDEKIPSMGTIHFKRLHSLSLCFYKTFSILCGFPCSRGLKNYYYIFGDGFGSSSKGWCKMGHDSMVLMIWLGKLLWIDLVLALYGRLE
jgi:hypothetical protein